MVVYMAICQVWIACSAQFPSFERVFAAIIAPWQVYLCFDEPA